MEKNCLCLINKQLVAASFLFCVQIYILVFHCSLLKENGETLYCTCERVLYVLVCGLSNLFLMSKTRVKPLTKDVVSWGSYTSYCIHFKGLFQGMSTSYEMSSYLKLPINGATPKHSSTKSYDADEFENEFTDTLFESLMQPYTFPNPKEIGMCFSCFSVLQ